MAQSSSKLSIVVNVGLVALLGWQLTLLRKPAQFKEQQSPASSSPVAGATGQAAASSSRTSLKPILSTYVRSFPNAEIAWFALQVEPRPWARIQYFQGRLAAKPEDSDLNAYLASAFVNAGNVAQATKHLDIAATKSPRSVWEPVFRGDLALFQGDVEKAVQAYSGAAEQAHRAERRLVESVALCRLGTVKMWQGDFADARKRLDTALALLPPDRFYALASVYSARMMLEELEGKSDPARVALARWSDCQQVAGLSQARIASRVIGFDLLENDKTTMERLLKRLHDGPEGMPVETQIRYLNALHKLGRTTEAKRFAMRLLRGKGNPQMLKHWYQLYHNR